MPLASNPYQRVVEPHTRVVQGSGIASSSALPTFPATAALSRVQQQPLPPPRVPLLQSPSVVAAARVVRDTPGLILPQLGLGTYQQLHDTTPRFHLPGNRTTQPGTADAAEHVLAVTIPGRLSDCADVVSTAYGALKHVADDGGELENIRGSVAAAANALSAVADTLSALASDTASSATSLTAFQRAETAQWVAAACAELDEQRALVNQVQGEADTAKKRAAEAEKQLDAVQAASEPIRARLVTAKKEAAAATSREKEARARIAALQTSIAAERADEQRLVAERMEQLIAQNDALRAQRDELVQQRDNAHAEAHALVEGSLAEARAAYQRTVASLESETAMLRHRVEELTQTCAEAEGASVVATSAAAAAHEALSTELEAVSRAQAEAAQAADVAFGAQTQAAELRESASAMREQLRGVKAEYETAVAEARELGKSLAEARSELASMHARVAAAESAAAEKAAAQERVAVLEQRCEAQTAGLAACEAQLTQLKRHVDDMGRQLASARVDAEAARSARDTSFSNCEEAVRAARADAQHAQQAAADASVAVAAAKAEAEAAWKRVRELDAQRGDDLARARAAESMLVATQNRVSILMRALQDARLPALA
jgi:chromosome segregation ATPase